MGSEVLNQVRLVPEVDEQVGSGLGKAARVIGSPIPVRPAGLLVSKDGPGQLPMPVPGLVSSDH